MSDLLVLRRPIFLLRGTEDTERYHSTLMCNSMYICVYICMNIFKYMYLCIVGRSKDKYSQAVKEIKEAYTEADLDFLLVTNKKLSNMQWRFDFKISHLAFLLMNAGIALTDYKLLEFSGIRNYACRYLSSSMNLCICFAN